MDNVELSGLSASPKLPAILQRASAVPLVPQSAAPQSSQQVDPIQPPIFSNHSQGPAHNAGEGLLPAPLMAASGMAVAETEASRPDSVKKKRGRPRKFPEGTSRKFQLALSPRSSSQGPLSPNSEKRRGRPPGSGKKQQLEALGAWIAGSAGQGFTPHVITIATGEDVATKIMSFSQIGPRAVCVLSANGAISSVTLRQPASSGGTVTYEGRFEILSLSGSFLLTEVGGTRRRTGGLSVSLAGPDGRVIGGGVAGLLVAASPVQVVVGSFISEIWKPTSRVVSGAADQSASLSPAPSVPSLVTPLSAVRPGKSDPSVPKSPSSPLDQVTGSGANTGAIHSQSQQGIRHIQAMGWTGTPSMAESRSDTDINISLPGG